MSASEESITLQQLLNRLPELEWKVSEAGTFISTRKIPKGLFRASTDLNGKRCIAEIKMDIENLSQQQNTRSAQYLADKISRKINVLVALCHLYSRHSTPREHKSSFALSRLSTRQQWVLDLEEKITLLEEQRQALIKTIAEKSRRFESMDIVLQLRLELGEIEKRLTLAREAHQNALA